MRYKRAVEKLRLLAEGCAEIGSWPPWDEPYLVEMYAFGGVLEGTDPLEEVQVAGVIRLPPEEVAWGSTPHGTEWLADRPRLSKGGFEYWWRSYLDPVQNHYIRSPVRIWSQDGVEEQTLGALAERRFGELPRVVVSPHGVAFPTWQVVTSPACSARSAASWRVRRSRLTSSA
jgi:hypothetical protein